MRSAPIQTRTASREASDLDAAIEPMSELGLAPVPRLTVATAQLAKGKANKRDRERRARLRENEARIDGDRARLADIRREMNAEADTISATARASLADTSVATNAFHVSLPAQTIVIDQRSAEIAAIETRTQLAGADPDVTPPILTNARDALDTCRQALNAARRNNPIGKIVRLFGQAAEATRAQDFDAAHGELDAAGNAGSGLRAAATDVVWTYDDLKTNIRGRNYRGGARMVADYADVVFLPDDQARPILQAAADQRFVGAQLAQKPAIDDVMTDLRAFRATPEFAHASRSLVTALSAKKKTEARAAYEAAATPMIGDDQFKTALTGMAAVKAGVNNLADNVAVKASLVSHLMLPAVANDQRTIDDILKLGISRKSERMRFLFEDSPGLMRQCMGLVVDQALHATLVDIKSNGKAHSIADVNDYVGDKLNEPLMRWVIDKGIPMEVHATSLLASFARMTSQGFTDVIEIPSTHTGTKKWVCANPKTKKAKVVFQTLPGESYAIQTAGAFLFYEVYDIAPQVKAQYGAAQVVPNAAANLGGSYTHAGYKARNQIAQDTVARTVTFLLVKTADGTYLAAQVSYAVNPPSIGAAGEIVMGAQEAAPVIDIKDVDVRSIDKSQLSIFKEDIDYKAMYRDVMATYGIVAADIACIGRKMALTAALATIHVTPSFEVTLPNFNMSVFHVTGDNGAKTLLGFSISPEFFGEKSGYLVKALEEIGVRHITFVGTAGGLLDDSAVGDIMIPRTLRNFSTGAMGGPGKANAAAGLENEFSASPDVTHDQFRYPDLHVGVHSPITESQEMIEAMKQATVASVDCEAGFIADALKDSPNVSLYTLFYVGDVPGTHHSIGQGGVADAGGGVPQQVPQVAPSEQALLHIVKTIVGNAINQAQKPVVNARNFVQNKTVTGLTIAAHRAGQGTMTINLKLPGMVNKGEDVVGLIALFRKQLDEILEAAKAGNQPQDPHVNVTPQVQGQIFQLVQKFRNMHKIEVLIDYKP